MLQSYAASPPVPKPVNAQSAALVQVPPPSRNSTTLVGSARRSQKANSLPSAHSQSPPGTTFSQPPVPVISSATAASSKMCWQASCAVSQSSGSTSGKPTNTKPSSVTCGSGRPSMPWSRMQLANSTSTLNAASSSVDSSGGAGSLVGGAVAAAAPTVANPPPTADTADTAVNVATNRVPLITRPFSMAVWVHRRR